MEHAGQYVPGGCNIGRPEVRFRRIYGWAGVVATVAGVLLLMVVDPPRWTRLLLFVPAFAGAIGLIQARASFCAGYGMRGVFNVGSRLGVTNSVEELEDRRRDRARSLRMFGLAFLLAALVATGVYLAPLPAV